ncbi:hypothetical protein IPJ72_05160 [Candidatus Peregrinibacteria bacterium]|nr:MAG: hypothetical protein IPJ72_05160 [Candidatus Peregrinibacteria bacterium]
MKTFYLVGAILVFLMLLVLSLPQIGASCVWYLISTNSSPTFVLFQAAGLGAVIGGLLVLFWKEPGAKAPDADDESELN